MRCGVWKRVFLLCGMSYLGGWVELSAQGVRPDAAAAASFDPAEVYYQAWLYSRDAESLEKAGKSAAALDKLRNAQAFFKSIAAYHPQWKVAMVKERLELTEKAIAALLPRVTEQQAQTTKAVAEMSGLPTATNRPPVAAGQIAAGPAMTGATPGEQLRVAQLQAEVQRLQQELKERQQATQAAENARNEARLADMRRQRDDIAAQLREVQGEMANLRQRLSAAPVQEEMERLSARLRAVEQEREAVGMALTSSRAEHLKAMATIETLRADLAASRQQAADLERNLKLERSAANEVTRGQQQQLAQLTQSLKQKDQELNAQQQRIVSLQQELIETKESFAELRQERDGLLTERDHLSALLKLNEAGRIQQLIEQNLGLASELREAKERVERLNQDNNETKDVLTDALRDLAMTKSKIIALQSEKKAQDQRMVELEARLRQEDAALADGKAASNSEEAQTLRNIINRQLQVQERRKKAAELLLDAARNTNTGDSRVSDALSLLSDEDVKLSAEEIQLLEDRKIDDEFVSPVARSREQVGAATSMLKEQIENYSNAAVRAFASNRLSASREVLDMVLDLHPGHVPTMNKLGVVHLRLNQPQEAVEVLRRAVEMDETQVGSMRLLGLAYYRANDLAQAEATLRRALELDPADVASQTLMGNTMMRLKRPADAELCFKTAIAADEGATEALHNLAWLCARNENWKDAARYYQQALTHGAEPNVKLAELLEKNR